MNVSTTIPMTVQIRRGHLVGLILATAAVAAVITWLLVAVAFDSGAASLRQGVSQPTGTPVSGFPPGYRGLP